MFARGQHCPARRTSSGTKLERFRELADVTSFVSHGNGHRSKLHSDGSSGAGHAGSGIHCDLSASKGNVRASAVRVASSPARWIIESIASGKEPKPA